MKTTFTYPLPDDLYYPEVSGNRIGKYVYEGPEELKVIINSEGYAIAIDPETIPSNVPPQYVKKVYAAERPEVAYMIWRKDEYLETKPSEPEILHNGDEYTQPTNPFLWVAYEMYYDMEVDDWVFKPITKPFGNFAKDLAKERKQYVEEYALKYEFSEEIETAIKEFLNKTQEFIDKTPDYPLWKYYKFRL